MIHLAKNPDEGGILAKLIIVKIDKFPSFFLFISIFFLSKFSFMKKITADQYKIMKESNVKIPKMDEKINHLLLKIEENPKSVKLNLQDKIKIEPKKALNNT